MEVPLHHFSLFMNTDLIADTKKERHTRKREKDKLHMYTKILAFGLVTLKHKHQSSYCINAVSGVCPSFHHLDFYPPKMPH